MEELGRFDLVKEGLGKGAWEVSPVEIVQKRDCGWVELEPGVEVTRGRSPSLYEEITVNNWRHLKME